MRLRILAIVFFVVGMTSLALAQEDVPRETEALDFAHGLLERGLNDMAIAEYQKFIQNYPSSKKLEDAYFALAESHFQAEKYQEALDGFSKFKELYPVSEKLTTALLRIGQIYFKMQKYDESLGELSKINSDGLSGQIKQSFYFYMGKAKRAKQNFNEAKSFYEKALEVKDTSLYNAYILQEMAELEAHVRQFENASVLYARAAAASSNIEEKALFVFKQGEALFLSDDYAFAIKVFSQLIQDHPQSEVIADALANLMLAHFNLGQFKEALDVFNQNAKIVKEEVSFFDVFYTLASVYMELSRYDEAKGVLDKILVFNDLSLQDRNKANLKKIEVFIKEAKFQDGLLLVETQENTDLDNADQIIFLKAKIYYGLGNMDVAYQLFQKLKNEYPDSGLANAALWGMAQAQYELNNFERAKELYLEYLEKENNLALRSEALYNAVVLDEKLGLTENTVANAQKYLTLFPEGIYYEKIVALLGELYAKTGAHEDAITLLEEYLKDSKRVQEADGLLFLLGYNLQLAQRYPEAIAAYQKVTPRTGDGKFHPIAFHNIAQVYLLQENPSQAAVYFDRLVTEIDPKALPIQTYLWLAQQYLKEKKLDDAARVIEKAKATYPQEMKEALFYFEAEISRQKGDCKKAEELYAQALDPSSKHGYSGAARIGKGLCLSQRGDYAQAIAELTKALEENLDDHTTVMRARFEIARAYESQKNFEEALRYYLLVTTLYDDPDYVPEALWAAGRIFEQMGKKEDALKVYQEIVGKYPQSPLLEEVSKKIKAF